MKRALPLLLLLSSLTALTHAWCQEPAERSTTGSANVTLPTEPEKPVPTVAEARRQAEVLHAAIHSTLRIVHDRYYREDEGLPIPAGVLTNVFKDLETQQQVKLRWLAVEGQAMNSDHKPQDSFEKEAAKALVARREFHEQTQDGIYRRAASIKLSNHCLKCHVPNRKSTRDRTAGLVIQMAVQQD